METGLFFNDAQADRNIMPRSRRDHYGYLSWLVGAVLALLLIGCEEPVAPKLPTIPATGSIHVTSTPPDARIFFDGSDTGRVTPYTIPDVSPGSHTVLLILDGHFDWGPKTAAVTADRTATVDAILEKERATAPRFPTQVAAQKYTVGTAISPLTLPRATGGHGRLTYSLGPVIPGGLRFDGDTRTLTGVPTNAGVFNMTYRVVDEAQQEDTNSFRITVRRVTPTVSIADASVAEGDSGTTDMAFTVMLSSPSAQQVTVRYRTSDGTATADEDYSVTTGTLTFSPGDTRKTINVSVYGDTSIEPHETFTVVFSNPSNATIADGTATGTILNDDSSSSLFSALESRIAAFTSERGIGAAAVGIMKNGEIIYDQVFGWKDEPRTVPLPENVMMRIASVTKPITAAAVHELIADGILDLNDHVFDVGQPGGGILEVDPYPSLGDSRLAEVTVQHLLQHRGGWDRHVAGDPMFRAIRIAEELSVPSPPGQENTVRYVLGLSLQFAPGARQAYSNFGYLVLGLVIEKASGQDYMSYVREKVFAPLGVPAADVIQGRTLPPDRSDREPWYDDGFGGRPVARNVFDPSGPRVPWPDGGWHLEAMIAHGGLVASTHAILQFLDVHQIAGPDIGQRRRSSGWWYHAGSLDGTNTIALQRDNGVNYVVFFNRRRHHSDEAAAYVDEIRELIDDVLTSHGVQPPVLAGTERYGEREADDLNVHP